MLQPHTALNIDVLERLARRRLPRVLYDWVAGGVEDELGLARARQAFERIRIVPRYLRDVGSRELTTSLFGRTYKLPFGIAPTGYTGLLRRGGECMLAEESARTGIPYVLSGVSVEPLEKIVKIAPNHAWYQLYPARDAAVCDDLVRRARDAGYGTLVLTVDLPVTAKRERDIRNGFGVPVSLTPSRILDALAHPGWTLEYLRHGGLPPLGSWARYAGVGARPAEIATFVAQQGEPPQTWSDVDRYRRLFPGRLLLKGILHPDDARQALEAGVDGIVVSNHGARQLDRAPASLAALPAIRSVVGSRAVLLLDGGVRRGADILIALALGADFVLVGRSILFGLIAGGRPGAARAIDILATELSLTMAQAGMTSIVEVRADSHSSRQVQMARRSGDGDSECISSMLCK